MKKQSRIEVGMEVAFNTLSDATWFTVERIAGPILTVREVGRPEYRHQHIDRCYVKQSRTAKQAAI